MHLCLGQLTWPELLMLGTKLSRARRRSFQAAVQSRSIEQVWDMIRIINDLADVADDVDRELVRALPPWLVR
jgi:hypothetical protein